MTPWNETTPRRRPVGRRHAHGSAVITVLVLAAVTAVIASGFLFRAAQEAKLASRSFYLAMAINLAEAGIEEGILALNSATYTNANGWSLVSGTSGDYYKVITAGLNFTQATGAIYVRLDNTGGTDPAIIAAGVINAPNQNRIVKQLRVRTTVRHLWSSAMVAKGTITLVGKASVDSFDSSLGPWNSATNRSDKAIVSTTSAAAQAIELDDKSEIYGYVTTGGADPDVGKHGRVYGVTTPADVDVDPSRVRKDFSANIPDAVAPTGTATSLGNIITTLTLPRTGDTPGANGRYLYTATSIALDHSDELFIRGPVDLIVTGNTIVSNQGSITVGTAGETTSSFNFYSPGTINLKAKGMKNAVGTPKQIAIYGTAPTGTIQSILIQHDYDYMGTIYAPNGDLELKSSGDIIGAVIANTVSLSNKSVLHYDVRLGDLPVGNATGGGAVRLGGWCELTAAPGSSDAFARDNRVPFSSLF